MVRLLWILLCFQSLWLKGQPVTVDQDNALQNLSFEHYGQTEGLSQGTINAVVSYDGFMWFATQDGLNRFDGYGFKVLRKGGAHTLTNNLIQTLLVDSHNRLWIGTGGGLNLHDRQTGLIQTFSEAFGVQHQLDTIPIHQLLEDKQGRIWIITVAEGLFCFDPSSKQISTYFPKDNTLHGCCVAPNGQIWVMTFNDVFRFDSQKKAFVPLYARERLKTRSLFRSVLADRNGALWIGTIDDGAFKVEDADSWNTVVHFQQGHTTRHLTGSEVVSFLCDRRGDVWLGTRTGGICIYHPATRQFSYVRNTRNNPRSLVENFVLTMYQDKQGLIWVGNSSQGIDKYDPNRFPFGLIQQGVEETRQSLPDNMIFRLAALDDDLYIGTETGGFARYAIKTKRITSFQHAFPATANALSNEVRAITADSDKKLWFANWHELSQYDPLTQAVRTYPVVGPRKQLYVYGVHVLNDAIGKPAEIWVIGQGGLTRFDVSAKKWKDWQDSPALNEISHYTIRLIYQHSAGQIWMGTLGNGLIGYNLLTRKTIRFDTHNGLACSNIRSLLQVGQLLWVGTDCGLFCIDLVRMAIKHHFSSHQGPSAYRLPNDVIYGILIDDEGYLWLSSNQGLTRFSPASGILKNYDVADGLQSNEFNTNVCYRHTDGTLFFGGVNGITYFKTSQLRQNRFVPPVQITNVKVLDSVYLPIPKTLTLKYDQNFIAFEFAALNFSNTQKNKYQYQLDGIDPGWVNGQNQRSANYTKLPPGDYVFRVKGSNDDGLWNEQSAELAFVIKPPFWGTWWFRALLIALLMGGLYGIYQYRIYDLKNRQAHELSVSIRTQELERQRFAKELHDGVGTNLAVLKMYLSSLGTPNLSVDELKTRSMAILKASIDDIRSIIHDMHPRSLTEAGLEQTIREMVLLINESQQLLITFTAQQVPQQLPANVEINLFRVVQELLQNAVKHAQASQVGLQLAYDSGTLRLTYHDNGRGFNQSLNGQSTGHGLVNINQRISLLKGIYTFKSAENQGTTVEISVPVSA